VFDAPASWRLEIEPIAIRGDRLALSHDRFRDTDEADRPIAVELLSITEVGEDGLCYSAVHLDVNDITGALRKLTARWIASGEVTHPQAIETHLRLLENLSRHDWDAWGASIANATYVNHRQLGNGETIADFTASVAAVASLIPNVYVVPTEILTYSGSGVACDVVARGTTSEGAEVEIPMVLLSLFDGDRLTRFEIFDPDQRDQALARFDELNKA
jgi:hypothetical protein